MYTCSTVRWPLLNVRKRYDGVRSSRVALGKYSIGLQANVGNGSLFSRGGFEDRITLIFQTKTVQRSNWPTIVLDLQLART